MPVPAAAQAQKRRRFAQSRLVGAEVELRGRVPASSICLCGEHYDIRAIVQCPYLKGATTDQHTHELLQVPYIFILRTVLLPVLLCM